MHLGGYLERARHYVWGNRCLLPIVEVEHKGSRMVLQVLKGTSFMQRRLSRSNGTGMRSAKRQCR